METLDFPHLRVVTRRATGLGDPESHCGPLAESWHRPASSGQVARDGRSYNEPPRQVSRTCPVFQTLSSHYERC